MWRLGGVPCDPGGLGAVPWAPPGAWHGGSEQGARRIQQALGRPFDVCREEGLLALARSWSAEATSQAIYELTKTAAEVGAASGSICTRAGDGGAGLDPGRLPRGSSVCWGRWPPRRALARLRDSVTGRSSWARTGG